MATDYKALERSLRDIARDHDTAGAHGTAGDYIEAARAINELYSELQAAIAREHTANRELVKLGRRGSNLAQLRRELAPLAPLDCDGFAGALDKRSDTLIDYGLGVPAEDYQRASRMIRDLLADLDRVRGERDAWQAATTEARDAIEREQSRHDVTRAAVSELTAIAKGLREQRDTLRGERDAHEKNATANGAAFLSARDERDTLRTRIEYARRALIGVGIGEDS